MDRVRITPEATTAADGRVLSRVRSARRAAGAALAAAMTLLLTGAGAVVAVEDPPDPGAPQNAAEVFGGARPLSAEDAEELPRAEQVRLGYFPNVTHAAALVGVHEGILDESLGGTELSTQIFSAGSTAVEALNAGALDAAFVGPRPAINAFDQSRGQSLQVISGASSGGAQLVVREGVEDAEDLAGGTLATPQLGGTQDVAARVWLMEHGLRPTGVAPGLGEDEPVADAPELPADAPKVSISPTDNAQILRLFQQGRVDAAWVPEPWASLLVEEGGGEVLVDERDLWAEGEFPTTLLVVTQEFAREHPGTVLDLARGVEGSVERLQSWEEPRRLDAVEAALVADAGRSPGREALRRAFGRLSVTTDPLAQTWPELVEQGRIAGTGGTVDLEGMLLEVPEISGAEDGAGADGDAAEAADATEKTDDDDDADTTDAADAAGEPHDPAGGADD